MPKETFMNLPAPKRKTILNAAIEEFSLYRFSDASINRIIKKAGIPRGSFYQYFSDKEDIFAYMLGEIFSEIAATEQKYLSDNPECDALTQFAFKLASTLEINKVKPEYVRITMTQAKEDNPFVKQFFELQESQKREVIELFEKDKRRGLVRGDVDAEAVIDMVYLLSSETFYSIGTDSDAYQKRMEAYLNIIREGIRSV